MYYAEGNINAVVYELYFRGSLSPNGTSTIIITASDNRESVRIKKRITPRPRIDAAPDFVYAYVTFSYRA